VPPRLPRRPLKPPASGGAVRETSVTCSNPRSAKSARVTAARPTTGQPTSTIPSAPDASPLAARAPGRFPLTCAQCSPYPRRPLRYRRRVHCPRCGRRMAEGPLTSVCGYGVMELSQVAHRALRAVADSDPVAATESSVRWGGEWYCPADGSRMHESRGQVRCPACGRHLTGSILYQLIEFHTHRIVSAGDGNT